MEEKEITGLIWLIFGVFIIIMIIFAVIFNSRCPKCKKNRAMKEMERNIIREGKISKLEEHKTYNKKGEVTGSREERVYGTRIWYSVKYQCKYCGYTKIEEKHEDNY